MGCCQQALLALEGTTASFVLVCLELPGVLTSQSLLLLLLLLLLQVWS
jgi:hypothetical protein